MIRKTLLAASLLISGSVSALDLGVQGTIFRITEPDIRQAMVNSAARVDWQKVQEGVQDNAKTYFDRLPSAGLPRATETKTWWIDPSITLTEDIQAPVKQANGQLVWQVLYPKGTRVNPLEQVTPVERMLFFDGNDPEQVDFMRAVLKRRPLDVMPVAIGGNVKNLSEGISRPVFYANAALLTRFRVAKVPALLGAGKGDHLYELALTELALPVGPEAVDAAWYGIPDPNPQLSDSSSARKP